MKFLSPVCACLLVAGSLVGADNAPAPQAIQATASTLLVGVPVEREMGQSDVQTYLVSLSAGQYFELGVDQQGIDVTVTLVGPDGRQVAQVDAQTDVLGIERL